MSALRVCAGIFVGFVRIGTYIHPRFRTSRNSLDAYPALCAARKNVDCREALRPAMTSVLGFAEEIAARFPEPSSRCIDTYVLLRGGNLRAGSAVLRRKKIFRRKQSILRQIPYICGQKQNILGQ
jgi:hypothetical protein